MNEKQNEQIKPLVTNDPELQLNEQQDTTTSSSFAGNANSGNSSNSQLSNVQNI